jgi:hypothetical protein
MFLESSHSHGRGVGGTFRRDRLGLAGEEEHSIAASTADMYPGYFGVSDLIAKRKCGNKPLSLTTRK